MKRPKTACVFGLFYVFAPVLVKTRRNRASMAGQNANITIFSYRYRPIKCVKHEWLLAQQTQALILL
ncbi:hypothetical protein TMES_11765 [Thalassospira mesophila]|uniref:Uncharacterized protein n=1 Tax=Thalassospira mesophila TaxID=1293891 RepID=A0A1Y2L2R7_9PROT|nr:hypothetical protein TMES_11765 [Thalassospira mesophila]